MVNKKAIWQLVAIIIFLEVIIYAWAAWTATFDSNNFFAVEPEFIFDKCARNSGRVSSALNLIILLMIGYHGLNHIFNDDEQKDRFRLLISLFALNHLTHFFYVFQNFKHHAMALNISDNKHGFITFISVLLIPIMLWTFQKLNRAMYVLIILHLFNVSYFIMETFYNKIKPDKPAYHNQFGIVITCLPLMYIVFRIFKENKMTGLEKA